MIYLGNPGRQDILQWDPPPERFGAIISISTIEHVGLGVYRDPTSIPGYRLAIEKLLAAMRRGGKLIATVPFGRPDIRRGMRIYNYEKIVNLIPNIRVIRVLPSGVDMAYGQKSTGNQQKTPSTKNTKHPLLL